MSSNLYEAIQGVVSEKKKIKKEESDKDTKVGKNKDEIEIDPKLDEALFAEAVKGSFTPDMLKKLKVQYAGIKKMDPSGEVYKKIIKLLGTLDQKQLKQLEGAGINFVSSLARNRIKEDLGEAKTDYELYHKDFSGAVQHAWKKAEARGYEVDKDDWDSKVATGPRKPGEGKTNKYSIKLMKDGKPQRKALQMQVYNKGGSKPYELNMYIESLEEATGDKEAYQKFFRAALKKFGVTEPDQLKGDKKKEFYNYVDKNWKADDEVKEDLDEARGRAKGTRVDDEGDSGDKNIIMQLRKVISLRGAKPVEFEDGSKVKLSPKAAQALLVKYSNLKKPDDKENFVKQGGKSKDGLMSLMKEERVFTAFDRVRTLLGKRPIFEKFEFVDESSAKDALRAFIANPYDKKAQAAVRKAYPSASADARDRASKKAYDKIQQDLDAIQANIEKELKRLQLTKESFESNLEEVKTILEMKY